MNKETDHTTNSTHDSSHHSNGLPKRLKSCVESWEDCWTGEYHPLCCRFPKSCSCTIYGDIDPTLLED